MKPHSSARWDGKYYKSLPPHIPGKCYGRNGQPCPEAPDKPCEHNHRSSTAALKCSAGRPPFNMMRK